MFFYWKKLKSSDLQIKPEKSTKHLIRAPADAVIVRIKVKI